MGGENSTRAKYTTTTTTTTTTNIDRGDAKSNSLTRDHLLLLRVLVCVSTLFTFPEVGCRQEINNSSIQSYSTALLIHPSSTPTTRANLNSPMPRKTSLSFMSHVGKYSNSEFLQSENPGSSTNNEKIHKLLRQIVPLPPPKKPSEIDAKLMTLYVNFMADFTMYNGWSVVEISFPDSPQNHQLCEYFTNALVKSKASLKTKCTSQINITLDIDDVGKNNNPSDGGLIMPIFSFYFFSNKNKTLSRDAHQPIHPKLLINYLPTRPIYILGAREKDKDIIIDKIQPEIPTTYKWTLIYHSGKSKDIFILEDIYGFTSGDPLTQIFGRWSIHEGIKIDSEKALGPSDFHGRLLRVTTVAGPPVVFVHRSTRNIRSSGYLPDILEIVSSSLNFTYEILTPSDNQFGNANPNGSWSGMVGMLQRKEAEIAMMSFSLTSSRKTVMDFSPAVEYSSVRLLIRRDWQNAELKWSAYLQPLGTNVWIAIPIFIFLGVITLAIFSRTNVLEITPFNSAWLLSSCFLLQGQDEHSIIKVTPYRLVLGTFWILSVVVFACYTARLTSFLAANTENLPIKSLSQAVQNRNWKVGLVKGSAFIDRIRESRVDVLRGLYKRISEDSSALVDTFQQGMDKVFTERYIFFTSELIPSFLIRGNCSYTWLPADKYFSGFGYMGYQKYLPFAPIISQRVADIRQSGQMKRLFQKWWGTESVCYTSSQDSFLGMSLFETGTAFLILILGMTLSMILMFTEFCYKCKSILSPTTNSIINLNSTQDDTIKTELSTGINLPLDHSQSQFWNTFQ